MHTGFNGETRGKRNYLLDLVVEEENSIKLRVQEIGWTSVDWMDLAKDEAKYRAGVNAVMK
jgi:hypothetical protein